MTPHARVSVEVNAVPVEAEFEPRTTLAEFLRDHLHLTGTRVGCEHGVCGACTIMLDGKLARSCITFVAALEGADIRTIEGYEADPTMARLRAEFHREHALQCGFCTAGMLLTALDIVRRLPEADENRVRRELAGNLCRCTGYHGIVRAIMTVNRATPGEGRPRGPGTARPLLPFHCFEPGETPSAGFLRPELRQSGSVIVTRFAVAVPRNELWRRLSDPVEVAKFIPGAEILSSDGSTVEGRMRVGFGPIRASFLGKARIARDDATTTGSVEGGGSEGRGSRASGRMTYRLVETQDPRETCVEIELDYHIQGALAQFSRSGLVRDLVARIIAEFGRNLTANLTGKAAARRGPRGLAMIWKIIRRWPPAAKRDGP